MTQETLDTTTRPYPTIEDKIALFKHHGIEAISRFECYDPQPGSQIIVFYGDQATADLDLAITKVNSIGIVSLSHCTALHI